MSATTRKNDRINFRVPAKIKKRVKAAASIMGTSLSAFITQTVMKEADEVIEKHNRVVLSDRDRDRFLAALDEDTPNEALQDAVDTHNEIING